jgi:hypothetical protein
MLPQRDLLKSWVLTALAMRNYGHDHIAEAQRQCLLQLALRPDALNDGSAFSRTVTDFALRLPVVPGEFVDRVLANLPPEAASFAALRDEIFSGVNIASAFRDYQTGQRAVIPGKVWAAVRSRPTLLANRGVWSILMRSLPTWWDARQTPPRVT